MLVQTKPATDEYAVMIDTRDPLDIGDGGRGGRGRRPTSTAGSAAAEPMKLASLKGGRDGRLVVVVAATSRWCATAAPDRAHPAGGAGRLGPRRAGAARAWPTALEHGERAARALPRARGRQPPAARLPVGRRLGLCEPRRAGAQGPRRRDAAELLDRSADVPGRLGRLPGPARSDPARPTRPGASISRPRWR